jgi:hypothetical protein
MTFKKNTYLILLILLVEIFSLANLFSQFSNQSVTMQDPRSWGKSFIPDIQDVTIVVKPQENIIRYDLYMSYNSKNQQFTSPLDTFEMVQYFSMPSDAMIVDSWLWVGDVIMKAKMYDKNVATNIYEGIVKRRQDPSILYKRSATNYEFRIFPVPNGSLRKVMISIILPISSKDNLESISKLPLGLFKSNNKAPDVKIIMYESDSKQKIKLNNGEAFVSYSKDSIGTYYTKIIPSSSVIDNNLNLVLENNSSKSILSYNNSTTKENEGYYQLNLDRNNIFDVANLTKSKQIIFIDHLASYSKYTNLEIKNLVKSHIKKLNVGEEFNIYYNNINVQKVSNTWLKAGSVDIDKLIDPIVFGVRSVLNPGLFDAYTELKNVKNGKLFIFSSDASIVGTNLSQSVKDELVKTVGSLAKTYILDYSISNLGLYYGNRYYYGNELFYEILSSNTKGSYTKTYGSQNNTLESAYNLISGQVFQDVFNVFEFYIKPKNGLCFDNFTSISNNNNLFITGKYKGVLPFELSVNALFGDSLLTKTIIINDGNLIPQKETSQFHSGLKIQSIEKLLTSSINTAKIVDLSKEFNVLSLYTSLLALEPGLDEPCLSCKDITILIGTDDKNKLATAITASPNPFSSQVKVTLKDLTDIESVQLIDIRGKIANVDFDITKSNGDSFISFDGSDLPAGMYIIRVMVDGKIISYKLIKAN